MSHFLTMDEVADELGVSRPLVHRLMERVKVGHLGDRKGYCGRKRWFFTREEIELMQSSRGPDGRPPKP